MEINERPEDDVIVLSPCGRLDNDTSPEFQTRLLAVVAASPRVLLDFSHLEYISSAGLRALTMASKQSKTAGGHLAVAALVPMVREIFTISRFSFVVQVFDTIEQGLAAVRAA